MCVCVHFALHCVTMSCSRGIHFHPVLSSVLSVAFCRPFCTPFVLPFCSRPFTYTPPFLQSPISLAHFSISLLQGVNFELATVVSQRACSELYNKLSTQTHTLEQTDFCFFFVFVYYAIWICTPNIPSSTFSFFPHTHTHIQAKTNTYTYFSGLNYAFTNVILFYYSTVCLGKCVKIGQNKPMLAARKSAS